MRLFANEAAANLQNGSRLNKFSVGKPHRISLYFRACFLSLKHMPGGSARTEFYCRKDF
jgi:hypothetical protein